MLVLTGALLSPITSFDSTFYVVVVGTGNWCFLFNPDTELELTKMNTINYNKKKKLLNIW